MSVDVINGLVHFSGLYVFHGFFLKGNQSVGNGGHIGYHFLLGFRYADFLHGGNADFTVFQSIDFVPVVVIMHLVAGSGIGAYFIGKVSRAVHKTICIVSKRKAVFIGSVKLKIYLAEIQQGNH